MAPASDRQSEPRIRQRRLSITPLRVHVVRYETEMLYRLFISFLLLSGAARAGDWQECRSGPFEVWTNGNERWARELLVRLEQTRHVLGLMLGKQDPVSVWPIRVVAFKGNVQAPTRQWFSGRDAHLSVIPTNAPITPAWQQQAARFLLESTARRMPPEWEEGILTFLSTLDAAGPKITQGTPPEPAARTRDWARIHFFVTNPEYFGRFRVLMNNLQNGGPEDVAFRNAFGRARPDLEKELDAYFSRGEFPPSTFAGRAINERDYYMRELETTRALTALADVSGNYKLLAPGSLESAEGLGLEAAAQNRPKQALDWLRQAVAAGSTSPRVHLEFGRLLENPEEKRKAFVEAAKRNARWPEPYVQLAALETTAERKAFYLKTAAALEPRDSALWQKLANAQLESKQFSDASKSFFAAEVAAPTPADRDNLRRLRLAFEEELHQRQDDERKRIADERQRELDKLKQDALNRIREAEARASRGQSERDPAKKVEAWWDDKQPSLKLSGLLDKVDCLGVSARLWVRPATAKPVALLIRDPAQIVIIGGGEAAFTCGPQKPPRQVGVEYKQRPDAKLATEGDVVLLEFR